MTRLSNVRQWMSCSIRALRDERAASVKEDDSDLLQPNRLLFLIRSCGWSMQPPDVLEARHVLVETF